jgi:hypothetical protein
MRETTAELRAHHASFDQEMADAIASGDEHEMRAAIERARNFAKNMVETLCELMADAGVQIIKRQERA